MSIAVAEDSYVKCINLNELSPWLTYRPNTEEYILRLNNLNDKYKDLFILDICKSGVFILPKNKYFTVEELEKYPRLRFYRMLIHEAVNKHCPGSTLRLAIYLGDWTIAEDDVPIFAFQKRRGSKNILLPDIDFLFNKFYADITYDDEQAFSQKSDVAIFVGSTSGGGMIDFKDISTLGHPRLKSAEFFRNSDHVKFLLPKIVQCLSKEVEDELRKLGYGDSYVTWQQQFNYKFILSVDGNGATCSRVAVALKSNSVLVKYDSQYILNYFSLMVPWMHFIPVSSDRDVEFIVQMERDYPGCFRHIADEGKKFYASCLSRDNAVMSTGLLIKECAKLISNRTNLA